MKKVELDPLGFVKTKSVGEEVKARRSIVEIILNEELADASDGIEEFSHLFIISWMLKISSAERKKMKVRPRGREELPLLGGICNKNSQPSESYRADSG